MPNYTSTYSERWENLTLANNFMFCKIMESEPELCRELLELLLHIKIDRLEKPVGERTIQESISSCLEKDFQSILLRISARKTGQQC